MQQTIKLETKKLEAVALAAGITPEKFIEESRAISTGQMVCAHLKEKRGRYSIFILTCGVRTLARRGASRKAARVNGTRKGAAR